MHSVLLVMAVILMPPTHTHIMLYSARWLATCRQLLDDEDAWAACRAASPSTATGCQAVVSLLLGDDAALDASTSSWLELLIATLVHVHPMAKPQAELRTLLTRCQARTAHEAPLPEVEMFLQPLSTLLPLAGDADVQVGLTHSRRCESLRKPTLIH